MVLFLLYNPVTMTGAPVGDSGIKPLFLKQISKQTGPQSTLRFNEEAEQSSIN